MIWCYYTILTLKILVKKLTKEFKGPYKIIQIHNNNTASIQLSKNKLKTYHFNLLKPYVSDKPTSYTLENQNHEHKYD